MKLFRFILSLSVYLLSPKLQALTFQWAGYGEIPHNLKFQKTRVGGFSGLTIKDGGFFAVSDDRGQFGKPRFYELEVLQGTPWTVKPKKVIELTGFPESTAKGPLLDLEGIASHAEKFIFSSEGDNNSKPRAMPRIFLSSSTGIWLQDLPLPDKYLPELTGRQTKGIQNNATFEGLACAEQCQYLYAMAEQALWQDLDTENEDRAQPVRLVTWKRDQEKFNVVRESVYLLDDYQSDGQGKEMFRGVSEILPYSDKQLLVLERGLNISGKGLSYRGALYLVDFDGATDVSGLFSLKNAKYQTLKKKKVFDFSDIQEKLPEQKLQNFEAMTFWQNPKGEKFLLILSDNNFAKREKTILMALKVGP